MTFKRVFELSEKFLVKTAEFHQEEKFKAERERLSKFYDQIEREFTQILNEMEGDLLTLKVKEYPRPELKEFIKVFQYLIQLKKHALNYRPYEAAQQIINFINNRGFKAQIAALNMSAQHFVQNTQVDFDQSLGRLHQASIKSLEKLQPFAEKLYTYMIEYPLTGHSIHNQPINESRIIPDPDYKESGPEDITKVEVKK